MFMVYVFAVARFLSTLTVESHPMPPHKPQDATSSAQPQFTTTTLHRHDAASYFCRCGRVARHHDIIAVPPLVFRNNNIVELDM
jgi:hypothetical protein